jgi:hypothetical protein
MSAAIPFFIASNRLKIGKTSLQFGCRRLFDRLSLVSAPKMSERRVLILEDDELQ